MKIHCNCLKFRTHRHHQISSLEMFPWLLLHPSSVAASLWVFLHSVFYLRTKKSCSGGLKSGDWLGHWRISHLFASEKLFAVYFGSLSILTEIIAVHTSDVIVLLLSAVTWSVNIMLFSHACLCIRPPPCLTVFHASDHEQIFSFAMLFSSNQLGFCVSSTQRIYFSTVHVESSSCSWV